MSSSSTSARRCCGVVAEQNGDLGDHIKDAVDVVDIRDDQPTRSAEESRRMHSLEGLASRDISEVVPGLFIGALVTANELAVDSIARKQLGITRLLSIGCRVDDTSHTDLERYTFLDVLDKPEASLFPHLHEWARIIDGAVSAGSSVLVHCVHGQSRSASAVVAYLMLLRHLSIREACSLLKRQRPHICINPGFLCQLICLDACKAYPSLVNNVNTTILSSSSSSTSHSTVDKHTSESMITCKVCRNSVIPQCNLLPHVDCGPVMSEHCDDFYVSYRPLHPKQFLNKHGTVSSSTLKSSGLLAVSPMDWMKSQALAGLSNNKRMGSDVSNKNNYNAKKRIKGTEDVGPESKKKQQKISHGGSYGASSVDSSASNHYDSLLSCPTCKAEVGIFRKNGLLICGDFLLVDLFALREGKIKLAASVT
jgi:predicted protein tyrosine phosphatase